MRVSFRDAPAEPITASFASNLLREVDLIFRTNSYGQLSIASTVTPLLELPLQRSAYITSEGWNPWIILNAARDAARKAGFNTDDYDLDIVRFDSPVGSSWANIGQKGAWLFSSGLRDTVHELGHNLGLRHGNLWSGTPNGAGTNIEYGNHFDLMGAAPDAFDAQFTAFAKRQLGWLTEANAPVIAQSGIYRLYAMDVAARSPSNHYALRVRKDSEREYWIEKRLGVFDETLRNSVLVYWSPWSKSNLGTQLLDMNSAAGEMLPVGMRFSDDDSAIHVIPVQSAPDGEWIDVAILIGEEEPLSWKVYWLIRDSDASNFLYLPALSPNPPKLQSSTDFQAWQTLGIGDNDSREHFQLVDPALRYQFFRGVLEN
jgi:hypothetical protein